MTIFDSLHVFHHMHAPNHANHDHTALAKTPSKQVSMKVPVKKDPVKKDPVKGGKASTKAAPPVKKVPVKGGKGNTTKSLDDSNMQDALKQLANNGNFASNMQGGMVVVKPWPVTSVPPTDQPVTTPPTVGPIKQLPIGPIYKQPIGPPKQEPVTTVPPAAKQPGTPVPPAAKQPIRQEPRPDVPSQQTGPSTKFVMPIKYQDGSKF